MAIVSNKSQLVFYRNGEIVKDKAGILDKSPTIDNLMISSCARTPSWIRLLSLCLEIGQNIVTIR